MICSSTIRGRHVLIATHGFNVNRADGIACLSNWASLLQLPQPSAFVGLLWPGDSVWAHGLDYPEEPKIADEAGALLAAFINANFGAASISFASHSLGARVVLETISQLSLPVRRAHAHGSGHRRQLPQHRVPGCRGKHRSDLRSGIEEG